MRISYFINASAVVFVYFCAKELPLMNFVGVMIGMITAYIAQSFDRG